MLEIIIIILLSLIVIVESIFLYKIYLKNQTLSESCTKLIDRSETLQKNVDELFEVAKGRDTMIDEYEKFIQFYSEQLTLVNEHMKAIDNRGTFESDDEVGYVYKTIQLLVTNLQEFNIRNAEKKEE